MNTKKIQKHIDKMRLYKRRIINIEFTNEMHRRVAEIKICSEISNISKYAALLSINILDDEDKKLLNEEIKKASRRAKKIYKKFMRKEPYLFEQKKESRDV